MVEDLIWSVIQEAKILLHRETNPLSSSRSLAMTSVTCPLSCEAATLAMEVSRTCESDMAHSAESRAVSTAVVDV